MRFLKRLVKLVSVAVIALSVGWTFLVFASAKTLGDAVFLAESDAFVMLALNVLTIPALVVLTVSVWRAGRARKRADQAARLVPPIPSATYQGTWGTQPPPSP